MKISIEQIKKLREKTDISISECKKALEEAKGDFEKACELLKKWGKELSSKKEKRETKEGIVASYVHTNKKIGAMIEIHCETDFVARNAEFQKLAQELCLQISAIDPSEIPFLEQPWIKDEKKKIKDLIQEYIAKLGENITIKRFVRYQI